MSDSQPIMPGATLGVLGGGQLGRMFALAAANLGYDVIALTPEPDAPISRVCRKVIVADYDHVPSLRRFAEEVSAVTIEFENIPAIALETLAKYVPVRPGAHVLHTSQNRLREKTFLQENNFPLVPFKAVRSLPELEEALAAIGTPAILKSAGFGYDGKNQWRINAVADAASVWKQFALGEAVLEQFVPFEKEFSVIGVRGEDGQFVAYQPIENQHKDHILSLSFSPACLPEGVAVQATAVTKAVLEKLAVVGVLCVEFFLCADGRFLINELAPRPHNSGHLTIEGAQTSQFEQQVRALARLPLGSCELRGGSAMINLLGDILLSERPPFERVLSVPTVAAHLYGKREARAGRKMGHLTCVAKDVSEAVKRVEEAKEFLGNL